LQLYEGFGLFTYMKSALLAAIFGITGGVTILLAIPAEEKASIARIHPEWTFEYGAPEVPQVEMVPLEEEVGVPERLEHSVAQAKTKTEKQAPRRQRHIARARPNFFEKLLVSFINLQKHPRRNHLVNGLVQPRGTAK
jgi:hypothetical protein